MKSSHIFISAGEISGDLHAAELMKAMKKKNPKIHFSGIGGKNMARTGFQNIARDISTYSTIGLIDSLRFSLRKGRVYSQAVRHLKKNRIDLVVLVDNQGFNIPLMKAAKKMGIRTVYYFPPHVSIWGEWNAPVLARNADLIVCPNLADCEVYLKCGGNAVFTGNPLLDKVREFRMDPSFRRKNRIDGKRKIVSFLPGSRHQEIETLLPVMLDAAKELTEKHDVRALIPVSHPAFRGKIESIVAKKGMRDQVALLDGKSYDILNVSDVSVLSSGTASLEAALFGKPPVICYRISAISFMIGKMLVKKQMIGLPNILLDRKAFPELLQEDCNTQKIVHHVLHYLRMNREQKKEMDRYFAEIRKKLGTYPVVRKTAAIVLQEAFRAGGKTAP